MTGLGLAERVRIAAISYDPDYDRPQRLGDYGAERGFRFDARNRFFRTDWVRSSRCGRASSRRRLRPGTVNRHRLELFVLDAEGAVAASFTRRLWAEAEVVETVASLARRSTRARRPRRKAAPAAR